MTQWVKLAATKLEDLSSLLETYVIETKSRLMQTGLLGHTCVYTHTHTHNKYIKC